jgi:hypothetical protein
MTTRIVLSLCLASAACGSDEEEESIDAEGCEHLAEGPPAAVTASAAADDTAPDVDNDHMRYDITVASEGFVAFAPGEMTDYVFFLGQNVPFAVQDSTGAAVAIEDSATSSPECAEIKGRHVVELDVATYHLKLGPTAETLVQLVIEESGHTHE